MPEGSWVYMSLHFSSGLGQTNKFGTQQLIMKFKELDMGEMVRGKGQSERMQLRPE